MLVSERNSGSENQAKQLVEGSAKTINSVRKSLPCAFGFRDQCLAVLDIESS